jgi:hypothetical protein
VFIPVVVRSKAWACDRSLAENAGSNPAGDMDVYLLLVLCRQVEVSATDRSLVERSPTEYGVSKCDNEVSIMRMPWPISDLILMLHPLQLGFPVCLFQ